MEPKFIVDLNVGRLAKWLRAMGYDTLFPEEAGDNQLVRLALLENRVLLTRDQGIVQRRAARLGQLKVVWLVSTDLAGQLQQVVRDLQLNLDGGFSRCVRCNVTLDLVAKEDVAHRLPPYVYQTQTQFMECGQCQRLYWRGTHWVHMMSKLDRACLRIA
ncbi:MAG: hypothetical protein FJ316_08340 [SAR202 cluster bacterium]|nr:hypothetical protein [SAR202 cluster bacterium]